MPRLRLHRRDRLRRRLRESDLLESRLRDLADLPATDPRLPDVVAAARPSRADTDRRHATALARLGSRVVIIDADVGLGNIDILFNLRPKYNTKGSQKNYPQACRKRHAGWLAP